MAIIQCPNNHYYDDKKDSFCPYCEKLDSNSQENGGMSEQLTSYFALPFEDDDVQLTEAYGEAVEEYDKTIGIYDFDTENELTTGWLVAVNGLLKGKSYTIHMGRNFAGRSYNMDISLSDDQMISREGHFSIVYEPKNNVFYLVAGSGQTYLNDKAVMEACELNEGDKIKAGQTEYVFVPFCKEERLWS